MAQTSRANGTNPIRTLEASEKNVVKRKNRFIFNKYL